MRRKSFRIVECKGMWTVVDPDAPVRQFADKDEAFRATLLKANAAIERGEMIRVSVEHDTAAYLAT